MSLPVSQYEALLEEVRGLREKAHKVQQLATPLLSNGTSASSIVHDHQTFQYASPGTYCLSLNYKMDPLVVNRQHKITDYERNKTSSEDECSETNSTKLSVSSEPSAHINGSISTLYHGTWPVEKTMWNSEPTPVGMSSTQCNRTEMTSVMSFASSSGGAPLDRFLTSPDRSRRSSQQLEAKVDMVYSLLSMLGSQEHADMGETLLALSTSPDSCLAMRQSGCIPLLVQLVQSDKNAETRKKASQALNNLIQSNPDEKFKKRETRVLKLLQQTRAYVALLQNESDVDLESLPVSEDGDNHPTQPVAHLMKLSFDEGHRQAICQLGGIHTLANLVETEHAFHGNNAEEGQCILLRRYSCMALTNLTFGDSGNKALLCSYKDFMRSLVVQLHSSCDELRQVTASVLRNLSWRADSTSKEILRDVGAVTDLVKASMLQNKENTLKSILSALWNLSAHCTENKAEICAIEGALGFLVNMLTYQTPSKSLAIVENAGGILRNISSQIAVRDDYRESLRNHNCLHILLEQLKSPSLTIVSNACGTLWNLSAKNQTDQELLWQMGAPAMLRSLNHSKHKMIAMGSSAALKNLLASRPSHNLLPQLDATARAMDLPVLPTLGARKQRALLQELDHNLSETFDDIEKNSPTKTLSNSGRDPSVTNLCTDGSELVSLDSHKVLNDSLIKALDGLAIDEPSTSFQAIPGVTTQSSPYKKQTSSSCYEKPSNYSLQYLEHKSRVSTENINYSFTGPVAKSEPDESFGYYAETDLDQPTDYSLRYAEDDSDSEDISVKTDKRDDFVQDTVKTYCTEGTPYETPFNFSTATSMSDLREVPSESDKQVANNNKVPKGKLHEVINSDEKDRCSVEDISEMDNVKQNVPTQTAKSELSSGMQSPEKPTHYAEEGTPGYFSRVSSFGSLTSIPVNDKLKDEEDKISATEKTSNSDIAKNAEAKVVKFEQTVDYAEETPLMFSRSSSLASLDSAEQHSIHEDRESVISDISRLTSGIISPSDLPDSPTQTVPPSPKQRKMPSQFCPSTNIESKKEPTLENKITSKPSIFEDNIMKFKEESTPVQFSTATSLSSLTIDDHDEVATSSKLNENKNKLESSKKSPILEDINNDMSESEEDDDILAACINEGMKNNRHRQSSISKHSSHLTYKYQTKSSEQRHGHEMSVSSSSKSTNILTVTEVRRGDLPYDTVHNYCTEDTPAVLSNAGSISDLSLLTTTSNGKREDKIYFSDDSSNLSGENENILAECIQSGMPKARKSSSVSGQPRHSSLPVRVIPMSTPIKPFLRNDYTQHSTHASSSNVQKTVESRQVLSTSNVFTGGSSSRLCTSKNQLKKVQGNLKPSTLEYNQSLSRHDSLSSLSGASLGSLEQEEALLDQCISSAMPRSHSKSTSQSHSSSPILKPIGVATKQYNNIIGKGFDMLDIGSKNVNVTSAVGSTIIEKGNKVHPISPNTAAGVEFVKGAEVQQSSSPMKFEMGATILRDKCLPSEEILLIENMRSGYENISKNISKDVQKDIETEGNNDILKVSDDSLNVDYNLTMDESNSPSTVVSNRMLDPDAMIESLDRFTAELISQAEAAHLHKESNKMIVSNGEGNTWDNDTSPNDITFPTISDSIPNVVSFRTDSDDIPQPNYKNSLNAPPLLNNEEHQSGEFSSNITTMIESSVISQEALKLVAVFKYEADMAQSGTSIQSLELDGIQPPSHMSSLTCSLEQSQLLRGSPKLSVRKRSLQSGFLAKRALSHSLNHSSLESLDNHSLSNLDHINPPSIMGDVFDLESSMISVASLSSEVAENCTSSNPMFNIKQPSLNSNNLENINPPSLFNEITDLCNSFADLHSETELFEDCNTHAEDDTTQYTDANSGIHSECAEVSPKKFRSLNRHLTPKQKRKLAQERYRTYTVAAEMITSSELNTLNGLEMVSCASEYESANDITKNDDLSASLNLSVQSCSSGKSTPKQRRQSDRARYQTQVLDEAVTLALQQQQKSEETTIAKVNEATSVSKNMCQNSPQPKLGIRRNFAQKRLENRERFKTQTLSESSISPDISTASPTISENGPEFQALLQKESGKVLQKLNQASCHPDEFIEFETLSLVSNDEESRPNSSASIYRTYTKSERASFIKAYMEVEASKVTVPAEVVVPLKPKITKPTETKQVVDESVVKGIRGRRKPLYAKGSTKPVRNITSNLVKNVTSTIKSNANTKTIATSPSVRNIPVTTQVRTLKPPSGYRNSNIKPIVSSSVSKSSGYGRQTVEPVKPTGSPKKVLERQATFTKENQDIEEPKRKIPVSTSMPKANSRIARPISQPASNIPSFNRITKSATTTKATMVEKPKNLVFNRSSSADGSRIVKNSPSTDSLGNESRKSQNGAVKRSSLTNITQRSNSNSSLTSTGSASKKQVTSKIASLWKKVEEQKKQPVKKDSRVWIRSDHDTKLVEQTLVKHKVLNSDAKPTCTAVTTN